MDADTLLALVQNDDSLRKKVEALILRDQEAKHPRPVAADQTPDFFFSGLNQEGEPVEVYPAAGDSRPGTVRARIDEDWAIVACLDVLYAAKARDALWRTNLTEEEASRYAS